MSKYSDLNTPTWQRIFIWIIAVVMTGGTIAGFVFMILSSQNSDLSRETIESEKQMEEYKKYLESPEYKAHIEEQKKAAEERLKTLRGLEGYEQYVAAFDAASVTELKTETLSEGVGATVAEHASVTANYTGWQADGKIFDSTKVVDKAQEAIEFPLDQVIQGWSIGLVGTRAGGVYLLTIPATMAYGVGEGKDDNGRPLGPLKFLVQIVEVAN